MGIRAEEKDIWEPNGDLEPPTSAPYSEETPGRKATAFLQLSQSVYVPLWANSDPEAYREGDAGKRSSQLNQVDPAVYQTPLIIEYVKVIIHIFGETAHFNHNYMINISWYISLSYN